MSSTAKPRTSAEDSGVVGMVWLEREGGEGGDLVGCCLVADRVQHHHPTHVAVRLRPAKDRIPSIPAENPSERTNSGKGSPW